MAHVKVSIRVYKEREVAGRGAFFAYEPATFRVKKDDTITWSCKQGPFAIHFGERSLLAKFFVQGKAVEDGFETEEKDGKVPEQKQAGMYKYSVAVFVKNRIGNLGPGVYIDSCPGGGYDC